MRPPCLDLGVHGDTGPQVAWAACGLAAPLGPGCGLASRSRPLSPLPAGPLVCAPDPLSSSACSPPLPSSGLGLLSSSCSLPALACPPPTVLRLPSHALLRRIGGLAWLPLLFDHLESALPLPPPPPPILLASLQPLNSVTFTTLTPPPILVAAALLLMRRIWRALVRYICRC